MELVRKSKQVITSDGEVKHYTNYYIKFENGNYVAIKPAFNNDYKSLYVLSTAIDDDNSIKKGN